jgi:NAD(P)-dependent dehydrogenase (short-subunit alcohol dehydrogenase family)
LQDLGSGTICVAPAGALADAVVAALVAQGLRAVAGGPQGEDDTTWVSLDAMAPYASREDAAGRNHLVFDRARAFGLQGGGTGNLILVVDSESMHGAWAAGASALGRSAAQEWPEANVRVVDLSITDGRFEQAGQKLVQELLTGGATPWVRLRGTARFTRQLIEPGVPADEASPLREGDVLVVSGGAKGVTARCLQELASATPLRFVLLGRSPLAEEPDWAIGIDSAQDIQRAYLAAVAAKGQKPNPRDARSAVRGIQSAREIRTTLSTLREAGSGASYYAADVCDRGALSNVLHEVRERWGRIDAVVHAAGVLADKRIVDKTDEQFHRVFNTKIHGLQALLDATEGDTLKAIVLFSSVAASSGNVGQADYAMANEVLERVAAQRADEAPGTRCRAIGWGPWNGGMVTPELARNFAARGVPLIELDDGAKAFVQEFRAGADHPAVVFGGSPETTGLMGNTAVRSKRVAVLASTVRQPWLRDHTIDGRVVVPIAMALEWLLSAAREFGPTDTKIAVQNLTVLRPVVLPDGDKTACLNLTIEETPDAKQRAFKCVLHCAEGRPAYRAEVTFPNAPGVALEPLREHDEPHSPIARPYDDDVLFHGEALQVLRAVKDVSNAHALATVATTRSLGWSDATWRCDPAAIDGALQLALLWAKGALGGASLPMGFGYYESFGTSNSDLVEVSLRGEKTGQNTGRVSAIFTDADDRVVAQLRDVNLVRRPDTPSADGKVTR